MVLEAVVKVDVFQSVRFGNLKEDFSHLSL